MAKGAEGPIEAVKHSRSKQELEQEGAAALARWRYETRKDSKMPNSSSKQ